jgi:hypothetical protein
MKDFTKEWIDGAREVVGKDKATVSGQIMLGVLEDLERLIYEIKESNDLLRSAFMIAEREGKETNWEAWRKQLEIALTRQHVMMYGKDKKV